MSGDPPSVSPFEATVSNKERLDPLTVIPHLSPTGLSLVVTAAGL